MPHERSIREAGPFALWLVPEISVRDELQGIIDRLCDEYSAPAFPPHVTVFAGVGSRKRLEESIDTALAGVSPFDLRVRGLEHTQQFFRSFYIAFEPHPDLNALSERIGSLLSRKQVYGLEPHMSLMYKVLPSEEKQALVEQLDIPGPSIRFDQCLLVEPGPSNSWADIRRWNTLLSRSLEG
jgi:2'-5' RNA ligase